MQRREIGIERGLAGEVGVVAEELLGIRSKHQLAREIEVNVVYRWFLGLMLTDPVFDA
jgi:transposase